MHVFGDGEGWGVVFVLVLEDADKAEHEKVIFVFGPFECDILCGLISLLSLEFELMNFADFRFLVLEKVFKWAIPNKLDDFDHDGQKIKQRIPRFRSMVLIDEEDVGVEIDGGDKEKPKEVDFNGEGDGLLESFEGLEKGFLVRFVWVGVGMVGLFRLGGLLFGEFHWIGFEI